MPALKHIRDTLNRVLGLLTITISGQANHQTITNELIIALPSNRSQILNTGSGRGQAPLGDQSNTGNNFDRNLIATFKMDSRNRKHGSTNLCAELALRILQQSTGLQRQRYAKDRIVELISISRITPRRTTKLVSLFKTVRRTPSMMRLPLGRRSRINADRLVVADCDRRHRRPLKAYSRKTNRPQATHHHHLAGNRKNCTATWRFRN